MSAACRPMALMLLCEFILNSQPAPPGEPFLLRTLLELYLADELPDEAGGGGDAGTRVPAASTKVRRCADRGSKMGANCSMFESGRQ